MEQIFLELLNMSLAACLLILAVMLLRLVLKKAPKWSRCAMWAIVAFRLVCPFTLESALSLIPSADEIPVEVTYAGQAGVQSGISFAQGTATLILPESLAPTPMYSVNPMQVVLYIAALLWLVGMAGMLIYMAVSFLRLRWRVREAACLEGNVWVCDRVGSPFILGIIRPKIYLPSDISQEDMVHVLAHERAHLKRRDHWWKPLGFLVLTVHWFNPLVWVAYVLLCRDIELACDEKVIRDMGEEEKKPYASALINCAAERKSIAACPLAFGETGVKGRIKSVLNYKKPIFWVVWLAVAACIVLAVCFLTDPRADNSELEAFLEQQLLEYHSDGPNSDYIHCIDYELLGTKKSGSKTVYYLCVYYAAYDPVTGEEVGGSHMPMAMTVEGKNGVYGVYEYWLPRDGSAYASSIREKFPFHLWGKALDTQSCLEEHQESCEKQLRQYGADQSELAELRERYPQYFDLKASKGLDVYVWQMAANSYYFALFPHTNSARDMSELMFISGTRAEEMRLILSTYDVEEDEICVIPWQNPISSYIGEYWIVTEGEDMQAKRERYVAQLRNMLFGDGTAGESADGDADLSIETQEGYVRYHFYGSPDPGIPSLALRQEDGRFHFGWSVYSSYYCMGSYEQTGDTLTLQSDDGTYTFLFHIMGEKLVFDAAGSSPIPEYRYASDAQPQSPVPDGAVFEKGAVLPESQYSPIIDTATADMDADGITEEWVLYHGPTSGLYTVCILVSENGRQEYFNIVMPSCVVEGFEKTSDGTLWIEGWVKDHAPSVRIDISINGEDIVLTENGNEQVPYWGEQGVDSPYNIG